jgi:branched-chain amino acid transport system permease protein
VGIGISLSCEWLNHSRLERQGASPGAHLISSLGIYIVVVQTVAMTWGNETKVLRAGLDGVMMHVHPQGIAGDYRVDIRYSRG